MTDPGMNCVYSRKYLRVTFEGTISKPLTRIAKHVYPVISSKYEHSVNIPCANIKK